MATLEREIDRLYALPLDEFTTGRNELARRLKREGDKDAADQVQALAKPSVPAWAINQLARQEQAKVKALLAAGAKLRKAQERALASGNAEALRAAQAEERHAVRDLTQQAAKTLEDSGRPASRAIIERISSTLGAAAVTEPARTELKTGRLTGEVKLAGFDALTGIELPAMAPGRDELAERRQRKSERERKRRLLEKKARELEARAEAAEKDAERAEQAAAEARATAEERRNAADTAASELAELEES